MNNYPKTFGHYLKSKRRELGLSQNELADRTKIQRTSISRLESATGNPQWSMIRTIAVQGLGISVADLFQDAPKEAAQPLIQVGEADNPKLTELMLQTQGKAIPIVGSEVPMRTKVVSEKDIAGYCVLDHALLGEFKSNALVAWVCPNRKECDWIVVDINDTAISDGQLFLVDLDGAASPRRAWLSPKGALILDPLCPEDRPVAFWGRQKDRVEVLGRIIMTSTAFINPHR